MKKCDYCGRTNDDAAMACHECGSSGFDSPREPVPVTESRELPLPAIAQKDGNAMILRCRTRKEAYLVCEELAEVHVVAIMPGNEQLWSQLRQNGYVEVRVSTKAYESIGDLRSAIEFRYRRVRAEQPLSNFGKLLGMGCGVMIAPGMLAFACLLSNYGKQGYDRMVKDLKFWFLLGISSLLLLASACAALGANTIARP